MIMSVEEAREILGEEADAMSDEQIQGTIVIFHDLAREIIRASIHSEFHPPLKDTEQQSS